MIDDVRAEVAEVWILEYRYQGPGLATGSFHVKPARYYDVTGTKLELGGGTLKLGESVVAERATLAIDCTVTGSDPQRLQGLQPLGHVFAGVRGSLEGMNLAFMDAYLAPRLGATARGPARVELDVRVERGVLSPGSRVELSSTGARLSVGAIHVGGPATFGLTRTSRPAGADAPFEVAFRSQRLDIDLPKGAGATVENVELGAALTPDLARPLRLVRASLAPMRVEVPSLGALRRSLPNARDLPELGGRAALQVQASKDGARPIQGAFRLALHDATLAVEGSRTLPWNATLASDDVTADLSGPPALGSTLVLRVDSTSALLPLVSSSAFFRGLGERVLELGALDAKAKLKVSEHVRLDVVDARSGLVRARGFVEKREDGAHGRVLLATGAANVGVTITPAGTETDLLVGDDWLASGPRARGGLQRPERGGLPQPAPKPRGKATN